MTPLEHRRTHFGRHQFASFSGMTREKPSIFRSFPKGFPRDFPYRCCSVAGFGTRQWCDIDFQQGEEANQDGHIQVGIWIPGGFQVVMVVPSSPVVMDDHDHQGIKSTPFPKRSSLSYHGVACHKMDVYSTMTLRKLWESQEFFHRFLENQKCLRLCGAPKSGAIWGPVGLPIPWISRSFWSIWRGTLPLNWCRPVGVFKRTQSILEHGLICDDCRIRGLKTLKHGGRPEDPVNNPIFSLQKWRPNCLYTSRGLWVWTVWLKKVQERCTRRLGTPRELFHACNLA